MASLDPFIYGLALSKNAWLLFSAYNQDRVKKLSVELSMFRFLSGTFAFALFNISV